MAEATTTEKPKKKKASKANGKASAKKAAPKNGAAKGGKKGAKKDEGKKKGAGKKKKAGGSVEMKPVKTGKGAGVEEIAADVVAMLKAGTPDEQIWDKWFHKDLVSIEGSGHMWTGKKAVKKKGEEWMAQHAVHGVQVEGPYLGATGFGVRYTMDVEVKATGQRFPMTEVGVYTVRNGKVVQEEFMYLKG